MRSNADMLRAIPAAAVTALLAFSAGSATAAEEIGAVSRAQGMSSGNVEGKIEMLRIDSSVFHQEIVSTGAASRLEVTFADGTQLTLGENAEMTLDRFVYDPASGTGELKLGIVGAFRFISGQASKMANADVTVTSPVATVGIRGTDFWGGPIDDQFGVLLIEGAVSVSNAAGEQVLDTPGEGTNIAAPGTAPGNVTFWPQDKVTRAFATVTFQ
jgi:hypothetical protein